MTAFRLGLLLVVAGIVAAVLVPRWLGTGGRTAVTLPSETTPRARVTRPRQSAPRRLVEHTLGRLPAPLQDAAAAAAGGSRVVLLGGLTAADTSTNDLLVAGTSGARRIGVLPTALHDAAAVRLGRSVYLFGGGDGIRQLDAIVRVDPGTGRSTVVGRLPAPSSDQAAAELGGTAYVVGGYTGSRWLDTIVAWRPGSPARVVARLPSPLRYAAVAGVEGRILVAGGSLPSGSASDTLLAFDPRTGRVRRVGRLPGPTTHAAAAALGGIAYVLGGRGALVDSPTARIVSVDLATGRVRPAGRLRTPSSDLAAVAAGNRILVAGGRGPAGTEDTLGELVAARATRTRAASTRNLYAADGAGMLTGAARFARPLVYVPNSGSNTVDVIDPRTYRIVEHFAVGALPQHVVPAWNLRTLYVTNDAGNSLTPIDPRTGRPGRPIPVTDPYNMYFTPGGRYAIVIAERLGRLDFRDPRTFALRRSLRVPCRGVDHMDFSANGSYLVASCEFSGQLVKVDLVHRRVAGVLDLPDGAAGMPQDVKLSPDGRTFYVADMHANGLWKIDGRRLKVRGFLPTGAGVHGLYPSRDARYLYATNRSEGSISVISFRTGKEVAKWRIPGGGSPDMGGVSADGRVLWLSGRYNAVVYAISTRNGKLIARIPVGRGPHGLCVWPQPGRHSLGHTGILRVAVMGTVRRHPLRAAAVAVALAATGLFAAVWLASPTPTGLGARVQSRLPPPARAVSLDQVSPLLREAVVATEDERYYRHSGVDLIGVARALPYDLVHLSFAQGASTITEQVAKLLYLGGDDHSPWRKLEDAAVALKLESRYTKGQILAAYLNSAYFGEGATGVRAASERYFGVPPAGLSTAQATLLAGLVQSPSAYDPFRHPALARARQVAVLRSLVRTGDLTETEASRALARPLPLADGRVLAPVRGVELSPGPAFVWWQLALGAAFALAGAAALVVLRRLRFGGVAGLWAARTVSAGALAVGAAIVVRSFRSV